MQPDPDEPLPGWPDDLPSELQPDAVGPRLEEVAQLCWGEAAVGVDCAHPPCMVLVDHQEGEEPPNPFQCNAWQEAWPDGTGTFGTEARCADGTVVSTFLLTPDVPGLADYFPEHDEDDPWAPLRHIRARADRVQAATGCTEPKEFVVQNRPGYELQWAPSGR